MKYEQPEDLPGLLLQQHVVGQRPDNVSNQCYQVGVKIARLSGCFSMSIDRVRFQLIVPVVALRVLSRKNPKIMPFSKSNDKIECVVLMRPRT